MMLSNLNDFADFLLFAIVGICFFKLFVAWFISWITLAKPICPIHGDCKRSWCSQNIIDGICGYYSIYYSFRFIFFPLVRPQALGEQAFQSFECMRHGNGQTHPAHISSVSTRRPRMLDFDVPIYFIPPHIYIFTWEHIDRCCHIGNKCVWRFPVIFGSVTWFAQSIRRSICTQICITFRFYHNFIAQLS